MHEILFFVHMLDQTGWRTMIVIGPGWLNMSVIKIEPQVYKILNGLYPIIFSRFALYHLCCAGLEFYAIYRHAGFSYPIHFACIARFDGESIGSLLGAYAIGVARLREACSPAIRLRISWLYTILPSNDDVGLSAVIGIFYAIIAQVVIECCRGLSGLLCLAGKHRDQG